MDVRAILFLIAVIGFGIYVADGFAMAKHNNRLRQKFETEYQQKENKIKKEKALLENTKAKLAHEKADLEKMRAKLDADQELLHNLLAERKQSCPAMAKVYADYESFVAEQAANELETKVHPAHRAADTVRIFSERNKELVRKNKELAYQISFWENLFPWLAEFKEVNIDEIPKTHDDLQNEPEYDRVRSWLSPTEYNSLSNVEKFQLALDRYHRRNNKTNWDVGIEYERYIGYLYEEAGYKVEYRGALDGLQDMGRDLIASKGQKKIVIQCKRWNINKTVHEKHIFQLFGSVTILRLQDRSAQIEGVFVTSTELSDVAKQVAEELGIKVRENMPMSYDYPCIKCNINRATGEKIYHLPFDQQYDTCVIEKEEGEFYATTVQEAEDAGFRRSYRWRGSNAQ